MSDKPTIPDELADLSDDSTHRLVTDTEKTTWNNKISTETDPTVPSWAKQSTKPTYTASEVGALPDTTVIPPQMLYYGLCDGTATAQTATISGITQYFNGLTVVLKFNVATQRRATININGIGAVPLRESADGAGTTSTNTTYCPAGSTGIFTYIEADGLFRSSYDYNSDTVNKLQETGNIKVSMATYRYKILLQDENGTYAPISTNNKTGRTSNNGLATPNTTTKFKIGCPIYYYESNTNLSVDGTTGAVDSSYNMSLLYSFTTSTTEDQVKIGDTIITEGNYLPVYLIAKENGDGTFSLDSTLSSTDIAYHLTQELPSTNTGYIYIYLGRLTSAYQLRITVAHPVYKWNGTRYDIYSPVMSVDGMTGNLSLSSTYQSKLTAQTAYTAKGTSTKVPPITTNSLGQVTSITEVEIAGSSSTGFITTFAEDLLLVNGTATSLVTGYYYTSSYHIKINGTTNSVFDDTIIFINNNYNSQQSSGQIDIWAIKDGNKYYLIQYNDDGQGNYIYQYYTDTLLDSNVITTTLPSVDSSAYDQVVPSARLLRTQLLLKEDISNKVTSLSSNSTDTQYPSAKCVYDQLATKKDVSTPQDITVLTTDWSSSNTYTGYEYSATKSVTGVTATNNIIVCVTSTATAAQEDEAAECEVRCKGQGSGEITLYCKTLPSVDIPITVSII